MPDNKLKRSASIISLMCLVSLTFLNCSPIEFVTNRINGKNDCVGTHCDQNAATGTFSKVFSSHTNKVDILIVDDNSASMAEEQANLATRFDAFLTGLGNSDWQLAVTSTDVCFPGMSGCGISLGDRGQFFGPTGHFPEYGFQFVLTPSTPNVSSLFNSIVQRNDEYGAGDERGIYAANLAIDNRYTTSIGFFRHDADLAIIILSDENERSVGGLDPNDDEFHHLTSYDLPDTLIKKVNRIWNKRKSLVVNAIVNTGEPGCDNGSRNGSIYMEAAKKTNGIIGCAQDNGTGAYTKMITNIGKKIQNPGLTIVLDNTPIAEPIVDWTPKENGVPVKWTRGSNVLDLGSYPKEGTQVEITYKYRP